MYEKNGSPLHHPNAISILPITEFAIETGMRRSEILKLRWCDVDLENGSSLLHQEW